MSKNSVVIIMRLVNELDAIKNKTATNEEGKKMKRKKYLHS